MLACVRWTLTHSSGWAGVLLALALLLGLGLESGLAAMNASRVAETVAEGEVRDGDGEDEPVWDGEPAGELDAEPVGELDADADADVDAVGEPEAEPDGDGDTGVLLGVLAGAVPDDAGAVGEAEPEELEELEEAEGDGDGESDGDGDFDGVGVGVGVAAAGSTSHVVAVFALAEAFGLVAAVPASIVLARAAPGHPASTPRVRDPPATRLSTAGRTCARRMKTALSPLLIEVTVCSLWGS